MDGILNIDKPSGRTSYDIVAEVKRFVGVKRVGHAGTLDPMATGVLPICLGRGTRIVEFLKETTKKYRAEIRLGIDTDTYDATGVITHRGNASGISQEQLAVAFNSFRGLIEQIPPMHSAIKYRGKRLYQLARAGINIERKSRPVKIYHLEMTDWHPPLVTLELECSSGTYVRSLAHDLGQLLGCGAHLQGLVRSRFDIFDIKDTISLNQFKEACHGGYWRQLVYPPDIIFSQWVTIIVSDSVGLDLKNGHALDLSNYENTAILDKEKRCRVYTSDGIFAGVLNFNSKKGQWQPHKIFL